MQRARIMETAVQVVSQRGFGGATIEAVVAGAGVSRSTFYEVFDDFDACFLAVLDSGMRRSIVLMSEAYDRGASWQEKMLAGLAALLAFLDSESLLARVCLVEALAAGPSALEYRARELELLKHMVDAALARAPGGHQTSPLAAEAMVASVVGILHARLVTGEAPPFLDMLGSLAALVIAPYVDGQPRVEQINRAEQLAQVSSQQHASSRQSIMTLPNTLRVPGAYRARDCLLYVSEHHGASNRAIADGIGIAHHGQMSTLLGRLEREGLLTKHAAGAGRHNAWWPTSEGKLISDALKAMQ
ncbi:MAG TPA: TetR/AcrR family transcriptional regulator [Solirubrobacteraceae bacterium]